MSSAREGIPTLLRRLLELPALNTEEATRLVHFGVVTLTDLEAALDDGRIGQLLGATGEERLSAAAAALDSEAPYIPLGRALDHVDALLSVLKKSSARLEGITPAGGIRRYEPLVRDIVLVVSAADPPTALDTITELPAFDDVLHRSSRRAVVRYQNLEVDLRVAAPDEYGTVLFMATGSREHIRAVSATHGRPKPCTREEDVYHQAGLSFIPAELRHATGEIAAAAQGTLPALVTRADILGDLHMHSTFSDGRDAMDTMVAAAVALGYQYIAITDHSERAGALRTLQRSQVAAQRDAIAVLRERYPQIRILHGVEVDIMPDGSLDFPDRVLASLDIVLASLHDQARHDPRVLTRRCIQAIHHPLVNVVTHPANRLVGGRAGYALDFDAVYAAAAETGTALEIDGAPSHLDMDGEHARGAVAAGVTVVIDSDCHRARSLRRQMDMGVGTARRGWVEARHVLNARPIDEVVAFVAAKRR